MLSIYCIDVTFTLGIQDFCKRGDPPWGAQTCSAKNPHDFFLKIGSVGEGAPQESSLNPPVQLAELFICNEC